MELSGLEGKTVGSVACEDGEHRAGNTWYAIVICFTDGTRLTLNSGSQYCDDAWIEVEIESLQ